MIVTKSQINLYQCALLNTIAKLLNYFIMNLAYSVNNNSKEILQIVGMSEYLLGLFGSTIPGTRENINVNFCLKIFVFTLPPKSKLSCLKPPYLRYFIIGCIVIKLGWKGISFDGVSKYLKYIKRIHYFLQTFYKKNFSIINFKLFRKIFFQ